MFVQGDGSSPGLGGTLAAALKGLTPSAAGGAQNRLGWVKSICSAPTAREMGGSGSKITCFSWVHHLPSAQGFSPIGVVTVQSC